MNILLFGATGMVGDFRLRVAVASRFPPVRESHRSTLRPVTLLDFSPLSGVIERLFLSNSDQETQKMMKWQYGLAEYRPAKRSVEAYSNMIDLAEVGKKTIARFLQVAGQKGWELCTSVPLEDRTYGPIEDRTYGLIF